LSEAARCAWDQNKFWEFQDELFMADTSAVFSILPTVAQSLGLDMPQFIDCVESRKYMLDVIKDRQDALNSGINSTPSLLMNGRKLSRVRTEEQFKEVIEAELKRLERKEQDN
jgi:protein-disulfide isomerase